MYNNATVQNQQWQIHIYEHKHTTAFPVNPNTYRLYAFESREFEFL